MSDTPICDAKKWKGHCGDGDWQEVVSLNEAQKIERELAAMKQEKHLSEQSASYNIDWFDCLVSASAVIEAARVAAQRKG